MSDPGVGWEQRVQLREVAAPEHSDASLAGVEPPDTTEKRRHMSENTSQTDLELTSEELEAQGGEELPDREAMSLVNANLAAPINAAVALNVASDDSIAIANAEQSGDITQSI
jgi:hypothetical protein